MDEWDEDVPDKEYFCHTCGGEQYVESDELGEPLWYGANHFVKCPNCGGTGKAEDCTSW